MFQYNEETRVITMSRGDTGALEFVASGYDFGADDRVLFTIKAANGSIVKQKICTMENNAWGVTFLNADTDYLAVGRYYWDARYVIHPYYDGEGNIVDGDQVLTPWLPSELNLLSTTGDI